MSIETEFQSTIQNVQNAYNGLNNLGATIPQNKTIENIKSCLDEIYNNLPKTEYQEGTEVTLSNTLKGKLDFDDGKVGFGQASQDSTQGYQLLNITATSGTKNGATWVVNEDKSITISTNGATTGLVTIPVVTSKTLEAGTYYMSGITGGTENTYFFGILVNNPTQWVARNYNGVTQFSVSEQKTYTQIWIVIATGTNLSTPITVYPMISKTNTSTYEPYTGGQASPNPSYPQQIKSVTGEQTVYIKDENNNVITTHQLSLGDIELNAIGNYKDELIYDVDEDKVYKNEKIGKVVLNGSENYAESSSQPTSNLKFYLSQNIPDAKYLDGNFYVVGSSLSNYLKDFSQNEYIDGTKEGFLIAQIGLNFCIANMTLQEFKSKLQQNNMYVYYITNATKEIPITDPTLVNQVKALYNAHSNNGTTIITSNGNLPMIIKVRGLKGE